MKLALALAAAASLAACAASPTQDVPERPTQRDGRVRTPFGYFDPSCVYNADATTDRAAVPACAHPHEAASPTALAAADTDGWKASEWYQTDPMSFVAATWTVPPPPKTQSDDQTLYYFPGLEPPTYDDIVQPVLAWNGYNDNAWTMTSWNCCESGNVWSSTPVSVSPGDKVGGNATGTKCGVDGVCADWTITSNNLTTGETTTLAATSTETFTAAQGGVLETYGVVSCSDLTAPVEFDEVAVKAVGGTVLPATWSPLIVEASLSCGYGATVNAAGDSSVVTILDQDWLQSWIP